MSSRIVVGVDGSDTSLAALGVEGWQVRDAGRFVEVQMSVRERQAETMRSVVAYTAEVLSRYQEVVRRLADMPTSYVTDDVREQIANLVYQGFVLATPMQVANATTAIANGGRLPRPRIATAVPHPEARAVKQLERAALPRLPWAPATTAVEG